MEYHLQSSQIRGLNDEYRWSQTYAQEGIIIALELVSDGSFSAQTQAEIITRELSDLLRKWKPTDPHTCERLVNQYIDASLVRSKIVSLVVGFLTGSTLILVAKMGGSALIKRGDSWSQLLLGEGIVAGLVQERDIILCQTNTFQNLITERVVFDKFAKEADPLRAGESLGATLHGFDQSQGAAAVFSIISKEEDSLAKPISYIPQNAPPFTPKPPVAVNLSSPTPAPIPLTPPPNQEIIGKPKRTFWPSLKSITAKVPKFSFKLPFIGGKEVPQAPQQTVEIKQNIFSLVFASPKKRVLTIAIILSLILVSSIVYNTYSKKSQPETNAKINLDKTTQKIEEGEGLVDLNNLRSRELLLEAKTTLTPLVENYNIGSKERLEIENLLARIDKAYLSAVKATRVDDPSLFLDLTVVKENALAQHLALYESSMAVLDTQNPTVITVETKTQATKIAGGGSNLNSPRLIAIYAKSVFTLSPGGLIKIDTSNNKQTTALKELTSVGEVRDMVAFAGNIYLLDNQGNIWRITAADSGYSSPKSYLTGSPISGTVSSMAIDGSIWVLVDNRVRKYTRGQEEEFTLTGFDTPPQEATAIYTDSKSDNLYLLDKGEMRILVFDKDGVYQSQYLSNIIPSVSDMVVSEAQKKIYLVSANLIYEIALEPI